MGKARTLEAAQEMRARVRLATIHGAYTSEISREIQDALSQGVDTKDILGSESQARAFVLGMNMRMALEYAAEFGPGVVDAFFENCYNQIVEQKIGGPDFERRWKPRKAKVVETLPGKAMR